MKKMYKGIAYSPNALLKKTIGPNDTIIEVDNIDAFPEGPNLATIGTDEFGETIFYSQIVDSKLSGCTRGVEGTAKTWQENEIIARNFTNKDLQSLIDNISILDDKKVDKIKGKDLSTNDYTTAEKNKLSGIGSGANKYIHPDTHLASIIIESATKRFVSDTEKTNWNSKETPSGAQAKVNVHENKKTNPHNVTKSQVNLSNVDNVKQASKVDLLEHKADKASLTKPGHIRAGVDASTYHTELTLLNGWQGRINYTKDDMGNVHLYAAGTLRGGVMEKNTVIAVLPEGYRPSQPAGLYAITTSSASSADFGVIGIGYDGKIKTTSKPISDYSYFNIIFGTNRS